MNNLPKLLGQLKNFKRHKFNHHPSKIEKLLKSGSILAFAAGIFLFLTLLIFAAMATWYPPIPAGAIYLAKITFLLLTSLMSAALLFWFTNSLIELARTKTIYNLNLIGEAQNDMEHAQALTIYGLPNINIAIKIINQKIQRIESRISILVGGSGSLAIFALAGQGWGAYKELQDQGLSLVSIINGGYTDNFISTALFFGSAFLVGGLLGAAMIKTLAWRLQYQLDILSLTQQILTDSITQKTNP